MHYTLGMAPSQDSSDHQDYEPILVKSQPKPLFSPLLLGGATPAWTIPGDFLAVTFLSPDHWRSRFHPLIPGQVFTMFLVPGNALLVCCYDLFFCWICKTATEISVLRWVKQETQEKTQNKTEMGILECRWSQCSCSVFGSFQKKNSSHPNPGAWSISNKKRLEQDGKGSHG